MAAGILLLEDIDNVDAAIGVKAEAAKNVKNVTQHVESVESGVLSATARQPGLKPRPSRWVLGCSTLSGGGLWPLGP